MQKSVQLCPVCQYVYMKIENEKLFGLGNFVVKKNGECYLLVSLVDDRGQEVTYDK